MGNQEDKLRFNNIDFRLRGNDRKGIITNMFTAFIVQPLLNLLFVLYSVMPSQDFGMAVIAITIVIRIVLWPLSAKALHGQKALKTLQPEIAKIKKKHKGNPKALQKATTELYKEKEINPLSSCLPTLLQLPILIGLYYVFIKFRDPDFIQLTDPSTGILSLLYDFIKHIPSVQEVIAAGGSLDTTFLGIVDLAKPNIILAIMAGAVQLLQTKLMTPSMPQDSQQKMMTKMVYFFPLITIFISFRLPAALPLYWTVSTAIAAFQQYLIIHIEVSFMEHMKIQTRKITKNNHKE